MSTTQRLTRTVFFRRLVKIAQSRNGLGLTLPMLRILYRRADVMALAQKGIL